MTNLKQELKSYRNIFENKLLNEILKFWEERCIDRINGGFYGAANLNGNPVLNVQKPDKLTTFRRSKLTTSELVF